jgi:DNA-binding response OmpR family regulator
MPKEILIVDDEPGVVVPIQFLMEQQGYLVMISERGEDALNKCLLLSLLERMKYVEIGER